MKNLIKAVIATTKQIREAGGVGKNTTVGSGKNSYQGIRDIDVKNVVGSAMNDNGLTIFCIGIKEDVKVSRWEEDNGRYKSQKQSVFCSVVAKYLLCHEGGESVEICSQGHGVDSQDKAAGKSTTYALKYALLHTFLVEAGNIDDTDTIHSNDIPAPQPVAQKPQKKQIPKDKLIDLVLWAKKEGKVIADISKTYIVTEAQNSVIVDCLMDDNFTAAYNLVKKAVEAGGELDLELLNAQGLSKNSISLLKTVTK